MASPNSIARRVAATLAESGTSAWLSHYKVATLAELGSSKKFVDDISKSVQRPKSYFVLGDILHVVCKGEIVKFPTPGGPPDHVGSAWKITGEKKPSKPKPKSSEPEPKPAEEPPAIPPAQPAE